MATRTSIPGTTDPGDVWTSANVDSLPGGWLGYVEVTGDQGSITSAADLTSLTLTVTVNSNRRTLTTGKVLAQASAAATVALYITNGSNTLLNLDQIASLGSTSQGLFVQYVATPAAGSVTNKLRMEQVTGAGTTTMKAAATFPAFIMIEDIGPSS